jgi:hypothetical protein
MSEHKPSFVGLVLKAIACTPNRNLDASAYDAEVVQPTRRIRAAQASLGDQPPPVEQMREMLTSLISILRAKRVEEDEISDRVGEVLGAVPNVGLPDLPTLLGPTTPPAGAPQSGRTS